MLRIASVAVTVALAGASVAYADSTGPLSVRLQWRLVTKKPVVAVGVDARLIAIRRNDRGITTITVVNDATGSRWSLSRPRDCPLFGYVEFRGPWLMPCGEGFSGPVWLYGASTRRWHEVSRPNACADGCWVDSAGALWVRWVVSDVSSQCAEAPPPGGYAPPECSYSYVLTNIRSGRTNPDPATAGGTVYDDLNVRSGERPLCPPLRYPGSYSTGLGSFTFYWPLVVVVAAGAPGSQVTLRRCHSTLSETLGSRGYPADYTATSPVALVTVHYETGQPRRAYALRGILLPSLRRFDAQPPNGAQGSLDNIALSGRTVYLVGGNQTSGANLRLWAATLP